MLATSSDGAASWTIESLDVDLQPARVSMDSEHVVLVGAGGGIATRP